MAHWLGCIEAVLTCADNLSSIVTERDIADRLKTFQSIGSRYALSDSYASAVGGLKLTLESMGLRTYQQNYWLDPGEGVAAKTCKASDGHSCNLFTIIPGESNRVILLGSHLFSPVHPAVDVAVGAAANASVAAANNAASYKDDDGSVADAGYKVADIAHNAADNARTTGADAVADATERSAIHAYAAGGAAADAAYAANAAIVAAASFSDGANDNGSGVVSTLETTRILSQSGLKLKHPVVISFMGKNGFNVSVN